MKPSTLEAIQEALLQVDLLTDIEEETGDFPEIEWIEAKMLVRKALDLLEEDK